MNIESTFIKKSEAHYIVNPNLGRGKHMHVIQSISDSNGVLYKILHSENLY